MITAVIFDLNGTVLSDEDEYGLAFKRVLTRLGAKVDSDYPHTAGIGVEENWPPLLKKYNIKTQKTSLKLARETQEEYIKQIPGVDLRDGFESFVSKLRDDKIFTALATSNNWSVVNILFQKLDLEKYFDVVTTREEVLFSKPDPETFLKTAQKLQVEPEECVVFEDSTAGIFAAKSAGMKTVGVARDESYAKMLKDADLVIYNYNDVSLDCLLYTSPSPRDRS